MSYTRLKAFALTLGFLAIGQASPLSAEAPHAAALLPASTQGFVRVEHLPKLSDRWMETQLGSLSKVEGMADFWNEQKQEIETRLENAGWQLNLHPTDIYIIASGQVAAGWIDREGNPRKPYSIALVIDIQGNEEKTDELLFRIENELKSKQAKTEKVTHAGQTISKYILPKKAGDLMIHESYLVRTNEQLLAADDLETIKYMLDGIAKTPADCLAESELFKSAVGHLALKKDRDFDLEYFVSPIGIAKVLRSISKKAPARQPDMLKVLENQGFDKLAAACGCLRVSSTDFDVYHQGFVLAKQPMSTSVQVLDFPNEASTKIPTWGEKNMSSLTSVAWNVKEAFWKVEGLVDEVAGSKDTFKLVIDGMKSDPLGPQIDIRNDVMPYLTNEIYSASDCIEPITPDSKRSLIAIRVKDAAKLTKVLDRAMKNEPDASPIDFEGLRIWKVSKQDDPKLTNEIEDYNLSSRKKKKDKEKEKEKEAAKSDEPWLSNWAITVHKDFLMFSSHAEMIQDAIKTQLKGNGIGELDKETDFTKARQAIEKLSGGSANCAWQIDRADRSLKMQYELFRQDKLPQSRSMMASIMDRLLHPKTEVRDQVQKVKGDKLPKFEEIKKYLMPSGTVARSEKDGWLFQTFVLKGEETLKKGDEAKTALTAERIEGTASSK